MVKMFTNAFLPELYSTLGVFISLIVVNCIVLGRAEAYASKNTVFDSLIDGVGMGVGYTLALMLMALFREVIGSGMITVGNIFTFIPKSSLPILKCVDAEGTVIYDYSISLFQTPVGAFIVFGLILATIAFIQNRKKELASYRDRQEKIRKAQEAKEAALKAAQTNNVEGGNK